MNSSVALILVLYFASFCSKIIHLNPNLAKARLRSALAWLRQKSNNRKIYRIKGFLSVLLELGLRLRLTNSKLDKKGFFCVKLPLL